MFRTRSLAARFVASGKLRASGTRVTKASHAVAPGDVLTFPQGRRVRILRIVALAERRGPAVDAVRLYEDLSTPAPTPAAETQASREPGAGRPTKLDRRRITTFTTQS